MHSLHLVASATTTHSVERLQLVGLNWSLIFVQVGKRILGTVVVSIIVRIDGLCLEAGDGVELLDCCGTQTSQCPEDSSLDLGNLSILDGIDQSVLSLCGMVLQLLGSVLLTKWSWR